MKPYPVFTVYGTDSCHYCAMAREILENHGQQYNYVEVTKSPEIQKAFFEKTDYVPLELINIIKIIKQLFCIIMIKIKIVIFIPLKN